MVSPGADERRRIQDLEAEVAALQRQVACAQAVLATSRETLHLLELKLEQTEGALWQLAQLITNAGIPIVIADPVGRITDLNTEAERRWGKARAELLGGSLEEIVPVDRHSVLGEMLSECRQGNRVYDVESRLWGPRGDGRTSWMMLAPIRDQDGEVTGVVLAEDVRELKASGALLADVNQELKALALVDGLTQLGNRRQFERAYTKEIARAARLRQTLSLAMIDVDLFKAYNDALGHPAGDACLCMVAEQIRGCLHRPADLVARYGGEEFAALLPDTDARGARAIAERMRASIEATRTPHPRSHVSASVTASIGVATARIAPGFASQLLLHAADRALYAAKHAGRNRVHAVELLGVSSASS